MSNVTSAKWLCTLNNPSEHGVESPQEWLESVHNRLKATYTNGQMERGENGTLHLQFYIHMRNSIRKSALIKISSSASYNPVGKDNGASSYCLKEETRVDGPWEFGSLPLKRNDAQDWAKIKSLAQEGKIDEVPPDVYIRYYGTLKAIAKDHLETKPRTTPRQCFWFWGSTGTGKTRTALARFPGAYMKMGNKWWDAYKGEKTVVMEEFGKNQVCLGDLLKRWSDEYAPFICEAKGGAVAPQYDTFVVTSNYSLEELFGHDRALYEPLRRRFRVEHFDELKEWDENQYPQGKLFDQ